MSSGRRTILTRGAGREIVLAALRRAGAAGADSAALQQSLGGMTRAMLYWHVSALTREGLVTRSWSRGGASARWWLAALAPRVQTVPPAPRTCAQPPRRISLAADAPVIERDGVRVTLCPSNRDTRYTPDPAVAGRGEITRDWRARRAAEMAR